MIVREVCDRGPQVSQRSVETALARAVGLGQLTVVKGTDDGAVYGLASYAKANPGVVASIRQTHLRMLQRQDAGFESKAVRRWIHSGGLRGVHGHRQGHKCIPCGNVPHRNPDFPDVGEKRRREASGMKLVGGGSSVSQFSTVGLHPTPSARSVATRPTEVLVRSELVPPTERPDPDVSFVEPNRARKLRLRLERPPD
jgi:hypothetical protein